MHSGGENQFPPVMTLLKPVYKRVNIVWGALQFASTSLQWGPLGTGNGMKGVGCGGVASEILVFGHGVYRGSRWLGLCYCIGTFGCGETVVKRSGDGQGGCRGRALRWFEECRCRGSLIFGMRWGVIRDGYDFGIGEVLVRWFRDAVGVADGVGRGERGKG